MWKQIKDSHYEINEQGTIRNTRTGKIRNSFLRKDGYLGVQLYMNKVVNFQLHRLIAEAFIDNPNNKPCVNHKDSNRSNNALTNLEWVTKQENIVHGYRSGYASNKGSKNGFSKLTEKTVIEIRNKHHSGISYKTLAVMYNISYGAIAGICNRVSWKHI